MVRQKTKATGNGHNSIHKHLKQTGRRNAWEADTITVLASLKYEPLFLANEWDLSPIKMPIANAAKRVFAFPELRRSSTFKGLPGLLADVLPDKCGNSLINAWLLKNDRRLLIFATLTARQAHG